MLYEALGVIAGPFLKLTIVKMKRPNKPFYSNNTIEVLPNWLKEIVYTIFH